MSNGTKMWWEDRSEHFRHFEIKTNDGNTAVIYGKRNMPKETLNALAEMIDAAVKAANEGKLPNREPYQGGDS